MGLIIKNKIQELMKGFPTVSDKYNVSGAVLEGSTAVQFGELVKFGSTQGYFAAATSMSDVSEVGGFVLGTNVKLNELWPEGRVQVNPGEAFNLLVNGFMAIELDATADPDYILPNAAVYVILATGKLTTADQASAGTVVALPNTVFTGIKELHGAAYYAEIYVK